MITRNKLTTGSTAAPAASFTTAPIAPSLNRLVLAFVANVRGGGAAAGDPTAQGNLTWQEIATVPISGATDHRITCFRAMRTIGPVPPAAGLTFSFLNQQQAGCAWSIFEYEGVDISGADGAGAVIQPLTKSDSGPGTLSLLLGPLADPAASVVAAGITLNARKAVNQGAGLAEVDEQLFGQGGQAGTLETQDRTGGGQTIDWTWAGVSNAAAIALEIKAAAVAAPPPPPPPPDDPEILARRFEPVLFFHTAERFFPSDAKRYVEQCALWKALTPFDAKGSWTSLIPKGKIGRSTANLEPSSATVSSTLRQRNASSILRDGRMRPAWPRT